MIIKRKFFSNEGKIVKALRAQKAQSKRKWIAGFSNRKPGAGEIVNPTAEQVKKGRLNAKIDSIHRGEYTLNDKINYKDSLRNPTPKDKMRKIKHKIAGEGNKERIKNHQAELDHGQDWQPGSRLTLMEYTNGRY